MASKTQNLSAATTTEIKRNRELAMRQAQVDREEKEKNLASLGDLSGSEDNIVQYQGEDYVLVQGREPFRGIGWTDTSMILSDPKCSYILQGELNHVQDNTFIKVNICERIEGIELPEPLEAVMRPAMKVNKETGKWELSESENIMQVRKVTDIYYSDKVRDDGKKIAYINKPGVNILSNMRQWANEQIQSKQTTIANEISQDMAKYKDLLALDEDDVKAMTEDERIRYRVMKRELREGINMKKTVVQLLLK